MTERDIAAVRQELANTPLPDAAGARVELATMVRMGGVWQRRGGSGRGASMLVSSRVGAVVRRITHLCDVVDLPPPGLEMREPGGVRSTTTWAARLEQDALVSLAVIDPAGTPVPYLPDWRAAPTAALRGILLVCTSVSSPRSAAHLEVALPTNALAGDVERLLASVDVRVHHDADRQRMVAKSGAAIVAALSAAGADSAAADHREHQRRRVDRSTAVALTNADQANLRRAVAAAHDQIADLRRLREATGWEHVPVPLQQVALARLANPSATLSEIGELCDPPVGKSTVHRRMGQLRELARRIDEDEDADGAAAADRPDS